MFKEFREFLSERNMLDLAVGVVIGGAFTNIIKSLVDNFLNPLIGLFVKADTLKALYFQINGSKFFYGSFINDVIYFLISAYFVFLIIRLLNRYFSIKKKEDSKTEQETLLTLKEIRDLLKDKK